MVKICILEDSENDTISRYSFLTQTPHEVQVVLDENILFSLGRTYKDRVQRAVTSQLSEAGFNSDNIRYGFDNIPTDAFIYFCDGLEGKCLDLADKLGREKVYINTGDLDLKKIARERGLIVVDKSIKDIVSELK